MAFEGVKSMHFARKLWVKIRNWFLKSPFFAPCGI